MQKLSEEEIKRIRYRRKKFIEKMNELELAMSGRWRSIEPYTRTADGKYSERKTCSLIGKLMDCLRQWLQYYSERSLTQEEQEFYISFLYCTIRGVQCSPYPEEEWKECRTLNDIYVMAKDPDTMRISRDTQLFFCESYFMPEISGFFGAMDDTYRLLTGKEMHSTLTEEEVERMNREYGDTIEEICRSTEESTAFLYEGFESEEEAQAYWQAESEKEAQESWDAMSEEEKEFQEEEEAYFQQQEAEKQEWVASFACKERFLEQYQIYRKRYFQVERKDFVENIDRMLELFLYQEGLSGYGEEEAYLTSYALLSKTVRQFERDTRRNGDGSGRRI